jgi:hypothetical protein
MTDGTKALSSSVQLRNCGYVQVQPDNLGKKLQTFVNPDPQDPTELIHSEAIVVVDSAGVAIPFGGSLVDPAVAKRVNEIDFTWNGDGTVATAVYKDSAVATLFTLTFSYTNGNVTKILRS